MGEANEAEEKLIEIIALRLLQRKHPQAKTLEDGHIFSDGLVKYYLRDAGVLLELLPELAEKAGYLPVEPVQFEVLSDELLYEFYYGKRPDNKSDLEIYLTDKDNFSYKDIQQFIQIILTHNEAKFGKLYRRRKE